MIEDVSVLAQFRYYPRIFMEKLSKTTKNLGPDSPCPDR
jgi:hypothetical protein